MVVLGGEAFAYLEIVHTDLLAQLEHKILSPVAKL